MQKNCKCLKYSHGAQYFAAASAINVTVFETRSFNPLMTFQGHMMTVVKLCWAPGDQVLFSAGMDGNVYGWPVAQDGRMEVVSANNRSSAILDLVADCNSTVFYTPPKDTEDEPVSNSANNNANNAKSVTDTALQSFHKTISDSHRSWLILSSLDGHVRMPVWTMQQIKPVTLPGHTPTLTVSPSTTTHTILSKFYPTIDNMPIMYGDSSVSITALALSHDRTKLFVGTSLGCLRVYPWPPDPHACPSYSSPTSTNATNTNTAAHAAHTHTHGSNAQHTGANAAASSLPITLTHATLCTEIYTHSSAVVSINLPPLDNLVVSTAADGSVFVHTYTEASNAKAVRAGMPVQGNSHNLYDLEEEAAALNDEVVLLALEDIEDHVNEVRIHIEMRRHL
ncbi:hypothetical protein EON64_08325 [archaeon]|nr:MAG: hypothetical protein EON64_08325 [archaeon]